MAYLQGLCLVLAVTLLCGVCHAHCIVRTLMPSMAVMECSPSSSSGSASSSSCDDSASDLGTLLLLARALEMDRASNANHGIDINGLLNTLIHALVYTATYDGSSSSGGSSFTTCFPNGGKAPSSNKGGMSNNVGNTGQPGGSGSGGLGLPATLKGVTNSVAGLLGGGEGGSGVTGLIDGVTNTVGGLLGGDGGSSEGKASGGLLGL